MSLIAKITNRTFFLRRYFVQFPYPVCSSEFSGAVREIDKTRMAQPRTKKDGARSFHFASLVAPLQLVLYYHSNAALWLAVFTVTQRTPVKAYS